MVWSFPPSQVEMAQLVAAILVELVAVAPLLGIGIVLADDLDNPLETAEERQAFGVQADQQIGVREGLVAADHHWHAGCIGFIAAAVRHEGGGGEVPQQLIQLVGGVVVWRMQQHAQAVLHRFLAQLAGGAQFVFAAGVEVYFSHI